MRNPSLPAFDLETFWHLIEANVTREAYPQTERLELALVSLAPDSIEAFEAHLMSLMIASYTEELGVAYSMQNDGYFSEDGFDYYRAWLISQGKATYELATRCPDSLAGLLDSRGQAEALLYVAGSAYQKVTGGELLVGYPPEGAQLEALSTKLNARFPG